MCREANNDVIDLCVLLQQLDEEIKRLKERNCQLEAEVTAQSGSTEEWNQLKHEISTLGEENTRLQAQVRELQAEIFTLHAKSPEVSSTLTTETCGFMLVNS